MSIFLFSFHVACPNSKNFVKCDSENGIKLFGAVKYKIQKDGTCQKVELIELHKISKQMYMRIYLITIKGIIHS